MYLHSAFALDCVLGLFLIYVHVNTLNNLVALITAIVSENFLSPVISVIFMVNENEWSVH